MLDRPEDGIVVATLNRPERMNALTFAVAAGAPIRSTMAILQHTAQEIAVLESSSITRPRDLDGKTYAGFGYPNEVPTLQAA